MFRCSSSSLLVGNNVTFSIVYNTQPGENLFVIGSHPHLGGWDLARAKRMTWNYGSIWDVKVGFPVDVHVQYKYFVYNEYSRTHRWEDIENRLIMIDQVEMLVQDDWGVRRVEQDTTAKEEVSNNKNYNTASDLLDSPTIVGDVEEVDSLSSPTTVYQLQAPSLSSPLMGSQFPTEPAIASNPLAAVFYDNFNPPMPSRAAPTKPFAISSLYPPAPNTHQFQQIENKEILSTSNLNSASLYADA